MKIHSLNCGTLCPVGLKDSLPCHCYLIETNKDLILVDTGLGRKDIENPKERLGKSFFHLIRPQLKMQETAYSQVLQLGFNPKDVTHIIPTHLDTDHAGGISDFPNARIHIRQTEWEAAQTRKKTFQLKRYSSLQLEGINTIKCYQDGGESWQGFSGVIQPEGLPPEILIVPLAGHSRGHSGIAVQTENGKWKLHAGDAFFHNNELNATPENIPLTIRMFEYIIADNNEIRKKNLERLRKLKIENKSISIECSHDMQFGSNQEF